MPSQEENAAAQKLASVKYAHRNDPQNILDSLPKVPGVNASFKKGGIVPKTGTYKLHEGETVVPAPQDAQQTLDAKASQSSAPPQPAAPAPQQNAPAAPQADDDAGNDAESDEAVAGSVNLLKLYSRLNGAITELFDSLGVKRSATFPHHGQSMADHITDVGSQLMKHGGITKNLVTATHTRHDPKGGATVAHPSEQLRQTIIPTDFEPAQKAVAICKTLVNKIADLVPGEPAAEQAKSQIKLIGQRDLAGMTAFDAGAALIAIIHPLFLLLARRHNLYKHGEHVAHLTGPRQIQG